MSLIMMNVFQIFRAKSNLYSAQPQVYSAHQYFLGQKMTFFVFQPEHTIFQSFQSGKERWLYVNFHIFSSKHNVIEECLLAGTL